MYLDQAPWLFMVIMSQYHSLTMMYELFKITLMMQNDWHGAFKFSNMIFFYIYIFYINISLFLHQQAVDGGNEQSKSSQFVKWTYSVLSISHKACLTDSQKSWIMQLLRGSVHREQIVLIR